MNLNTDSTLDLAVIGGGAAGFFAAISANEKSKIRCKIFEASKKPLAKLIISGGGRCNVTNYTFDPKLLVKNYPRGNKELLGAFYKFNAQDTVNWYEEHGVPLKVEPDNRMFPTSDSSHTVERALKEATKSLDIELDLDAKIKSIVKSKEDNFFILTMFSGESIKAKNVILATGSSQSGYDIAKSLGHTIEKTVPSLFTFEIEDQRIDELSGVSFQNVETKLIVGDGKPITQKGPLLITHWGMSGPAVIKLSAWGARELFDSSYKAKLQINFLPEETFDSIMNEFMGRKKMSPRKTLFNDSVNQIPKSYWQKLLTVCGVNEELTWANVSKETIQKLSLELSSGVFEINGKGKFKEEFVTCGGVSLKEVDFRTMQSKVCPGLFFAGEILDIDGVTGGFNFQAAWTTGWIAGQHIL